MSTGGRAPSGSIGVSRRRSGCGHALLGVDGSQPQRPLATARSVRRWFRWTNETMPTCLVRVNEPLTWANARLPWSRGRFDTWDSSVVFLWAPVSDGRVTQDTPP
ncbi:MAG: hypothetical protein AVDCRST_MAG21-628 [uncultured Nocardioidaceae bacterium]|uniref:Uncharacterized protein n=1 Tax=uncultured Nocardioidaceae bacterium TaxID=253824 RepID=A0A6J4N140_9ACTN|nr:MAG: hypothetical protein AVDCRST_MAG21-628 [uncultured Nocardioidaceae bacterium]